MTGMALGMLLARITMGHSLAIWLSFLSLTIFHMFANYKAVRCLSLNSLNNERSSILLQNFMKTGQVLSPEKVSNMENVLPLWITSWNLKSSELLYARIHLGARISLLNRLEIMELMRSAGSHYKKAKYLLLETNGSISVIMHKDSTAADVLQSFMHAVVLANVMDRSVSFHLESQSWMDKHYKDFVQKLQSSGWKTERLLAPSITWRANWLSGVPNEKTD